MAEVEDNAKTGSNRETENDQDVAVNGVKKANTKRKPRNSTSHSEVEHEKEADDQPAFSLATLGLQRVGTVPPPKPKVVQQPIQTLNARGMPARIRKRNRFFFDENIINDDKPLRMRLSPKKVPLKSSASNSAGPTAKQNNDTANSSNVSGRALRKTKVTPAKVLEKRKGVVSRYMRTEPAATKIRKTATAKLKSVNTKKSQQGKVIKIKTKLPTPSKLGKGKNAKRATAKTENPKAAASDASAASDDHKLFANKLIGQSIGLSLRNLLKLPKAHKWAIAEWFYSYIDKPLFEGDTEFENYINDIYPGLQTRNLTRAEWRWIRRSLGKPRRCSQAFFDAERRELARKRMLLRTLQSRKPGDLKGVILLTDMPDQIPMPLPVGTKVTARLRHPQDGIFNGSVDAYDSLNGMYRVTFERLGLGTHTICDYEIVSENFHEMLPLHTYIKDFRPNLISIFTNKRNIVHPQKQFVGNIIGVRSTISQKLNKSDPLLGQEAFAASSPYKIHLTRYHDYPSKLLESIVRLQYVTSLKHVKIKRQSDMNDEAQLLIANSASTKYAMDDMIPNVSITSEFQRRYASNIIAIEKLNEDVTYFLNEVVKFSPAISRDPTLQAMVAPTYLREKCREIADKTVERLNNTQNPVKNNKMIKLIKNLGMLLVMTSRIGGDPKVAKVLDGCMEEVQSNLLSRDNAATFQKNVLTHLNTLAAIINRHSLMKKSYILENEKKLIVKSENESKDDAKETRSKRNQNGDYKTDMEQHQENENMCGKTPIHVQIKIQENDDTKKELKDKTSIDVEAIKSCQVNDSDDMIKDEPREDDDLSPNEQCRQDYEIDDTTQSEQLQDNENMSPHEHHQDQQVREGKERVQSQEDCEMSPIGHILEGETDDTTQSEKHEEQGDYDMSAIEQGQQESMTDDFSQSEQFEIQIDMLESVEHEQVDTDDDVLMAEDDDQIQEQENEDVSEGEHFQLKVADSDDDDDVDMGEEHLIETDDVNSTENIDDYIAEESVSEPM